MCFCIQIGRIQYVELYIICQISPYQCSSLMVWLQRIIQISLLNDHSIIYKLFISASLIIPRYWLHPIIPDIILLYTLHYAKANPLTHHALQLSQTMVMSRNTEFDWIPSFLPKYTFIYKISFHNFHMNTEKLSNWSLFVKRFSIYCP